VTNPFHYSADNVKRKNTCNIDEPNMTLSNTWQACLTAMRAIGGHTTDSRITGNYLFAKLRKLSFLKHFLPLAFL
jgi:hypothetical protein